MFRSPSSFRRRLSLETLESRKQLAGVVELALDGDDWTFTGDEQANAIEIELVALGEYMIRGVTHGGDATKIVVAGENLAGTEIHVVGSLTNLTANLGGGDDLLRIVGQGTGSNALRINNRISVNSADGDDELELKYVTTRTISTDLGGGNDQLSMIGVANITWPHWYGLGMPTIATGAGKDRVEILESQFRSIRLDTGADADVVFLEKVTAAAMEILTGAGKDELAVVGAEFSGRLSIDTGADSDQAVLFAVSADEIYAQMGDGDDSLDMVANKARAAKLLGSSGYDVLDFEPFINIDNEFEQLGTDGFETIQ
jgi:hypothetical protein